MEFKFEVDDVLIVELKSGQILEGIYRNGSRNRIDIYNCKDANTGIALTGLMSYYRHDIASVKILNREHKDKINGYETDTNNSKKVIAMPKQDYENLLINCKNYVYIAIPDKTFLEAIEYLNSCENVSVAAIGSECGRNNPIQLLVCCSWDQVYIFDTHLFPQKNFNNELKSLLESKYIKKIVHDSRTLVDCLQNRYKVNLENFFDTAVADMMILEHENGKKLDTIRSLSECLVHYFNFPESLLSSASQIASKIASERPLNSMHKLEAAKLGGYLITLKNHQERLLLHDYYKTVEHFSQQLVLKPAFMIYKSIAKDKEGKNNLINLEVVNGEI